MNLFYSSLGDLIYYNKFNVLSLHWLKTLKFELLCPSYKDKCDCGNLGEYVRIILKGYVYLGCVLLNTFWQILVHANDN